MRLTAGSELEIQFYTCLHRKKLGKGFEAPERSEGRFWDVSRPSHADEGFFFCFKEMACVKPDLLFFDKTPLIAKRTEISKQKIFGERNSF
jgi:hypothetical protein